MSAANRRQVLAGAALASMAGAAAPALASEPCAIVELRQYLMQPGRRADLVAMFDREFVETQEVLGTTVIGQFVDLDRPDWFVWMRGFSDMAARARALDGFYSGPVWQAHRTAANATIVDSDNVLLLHPLGGFRPPETRPAAGEHLPAGLIVVDIRYPKAGAEADAVALLENEIAPAMQAAGAKLIGAFATEHSPNSYPRLPVREGERALVVLTRFTGPLAHDAFRRRLETLAWRKGPAAEMESLTDRTAEMLRLSPTARSALR